MTVGPITLHIGPAPSDVVKEWVESRSRLVEAVRNDARFARHGDVLDLLETILALWVAAADRSDVFEWRYDIQRDVLLLVGKYWFDLGQLTPEERAAMGAPLGSPEAESFTEVVVAGMVGALREAGSEGQELLLRLGQ